MPRKGACLTCCVLDHGDDELRSFWSVELLFPECPSEAKSDRLQLRLNWSKSMIRNSAK